MVNISVPSWVRIRARSASGTGECAGSPRALLNAVNRLADSARNGGTSAA